MAQRNIDKWFPGKYYKPELFWYKARITKEKYGHDTTYKSYACVHKVNGCFYADIYIETICPNWHYGRMHYAKHFKTRRQGQDWCNFLMKNPPKHHSQEENVWGTDAFRKVERYCKYRTHLGFPKYVEYWPMFAGEDLP